MRKMGSAGLKPQGGALGTPQRLPLHLLSWDSPILAITGFPC